MTAKSKIFLVFGVIFLFVLLSIVGSAAFMFFVTIPTSSKRSVELNRKRSAETSGTITSISERRSSGDKYRGSSVSRTYNYQYDVNGVTFKAEQSTGGGGTDEKSGLKVKVCYDPAEPQSSEFYNFSFNKTCGQ